MRLPSVWVVYGAAIFTLAASASDLDEFKIKRQEVFEFAQKPVLTRQGDRTEIVFESKGCCDVTVAVEDAHGKIVRHLACGVLGPKAPEPLQKNALKQTLVWDGKDDAGAYVTGVERLSVRVSLGLKPSFEKALYQSPKKRIGTRPQLLSAAPEGVYVYDCRAVEFVRLFDHEGNYVRTIYPFPANKLEEVKGLRWQATPQDGQKIPLRNGFVQATLLDCGVNAINSYYFKYGNEEPGATAFAVKGARIALAFRFLNRLATDGTTGGLSLKGPKTSFSANVNSYAVDGGGAQPIGPGSLAFSPDGKWLYLTGYMWSGLHNGNSGALHGVLRMAYDQEAEPQLFAGAMKEEAFGAGESQFAMPTSVACDAQGRVYVSDYMNDRVQIFSPDGKLLRSLPANKPGKVAVHPQSQEIFVFSWGASHQFVRYRKMDAEVLARIPPSLTRLGTFEKPLPGKAQPLPMGGIPFNSFTVGPPYQVELDPWAAEPTLWVNDSRAALTKAVVNWSGAGSIANYANDDGGHGGVRLLVEKDGKWVVKRDFGVEARKEVVRLRPADFSVQRLFVNPRNRKLYVFEVLSFGKCNTELLEIDPESGAIRPVPIPFNAEDICFDREGLIYLRTDTLVARYDPETWREVPWDYGEERQKVAFCSTGYKPADLVSALPTPGQRPVCWNQGGMCVSPRGNLAVSCVSRVSPPERTPGGGGFEDRKSSTSAGAGRPYSPRIYPGRVRWQELHIWDKHGKVVHEDAVPGLQFVDGVYIDADDALYVLAGAARMLDGQRYFNKMACTLMKFKPKQARIAGTSTKHAPVPLAKEEWPSRAHDLESNEYGKAWVNGAEWFYGGVGFGGFNYTPDDGGWGCACWNTRFTLDFFSRSFAPESDRSRVAVLDSNGNLILRLGRYSNADSAGAQSLAPLGGDEVGLFYPCFLAADTDRRLFIADPGNARIAGVKLDYHAGQKVPLGALGPDKK